VDTLNDYINIRDGRDTLHELLSPPAGEGMAVGSRDAFVVVRSARVAHASRGKRRANADLPASPSHPSWPPWGTDGGKCSRTQKTFLMVLYGHAIHVTS